MAGNRSDWFPTSVWNFDFESCEQLNQTLLSEIYAEKQRDAQGVSWSNSLGWHSVDNLQHKPQFQPLMDMVCTNAIEVANCLAWNLSKYVVTVNNCWALVNTKFSSNFAHNHPNSLLSGVYYVQAAEIIFSRSARNCPFNHATLSRADTLDAPKSDIQAFSRKNDYFSQLALAWGRSQSQRSRSR
jgi:uncharacterized protein (TIGR02466 family)